MITLPPPGRPLRKALEELGESFVLTFPISKQYAFGYFAEYGVQLEKDGRTSLLTPAQWVWQYKCCDVYLFIRDAQDIARRQYPCPDCRQLSPRPTAYSTLTCYSSYFTPQGAVKLRSAEVGDEDVVEWLAGGLRHFLELEPLESYLEAEQLLVYMNAFGSHPELEALVGQWTQGEGEETSWEAQVNELHERVLAALDSPVPRR